MTKLEDRAKAKLQWVPFAQSCGTVSSGGQDEALVPFPLAASDDEPNHRKKGLRDHGNS